jgi:hypothetical protein
MLMTFRRTNTNMKSSSSLDVAVVVVVHGVLFPAFIQLPAGVFLLALVIAVNAQYFFCLLNDLKEPVLSPRFWIACKLRY